MREITSLPIILLLMFVALSCEETTLNTDEDNLCEGNDFEDINGRNFLMGFSTWIYAPDALTKTYEYIDQHTDIYSEQQDEFIPWSAYLKNEELPADYIEEIDFRVRHRPSDSKLFLSVSLLNTGRNGLLPDRDGFVPEGNWSDSSIVNAYAKHIQFLVDKMNPDYLVAAMEANDLYLQNQEKWVEYKTLMKGVKTRLKKLYPDLPISESVTLHNLLDVNFINDFDAYQSEIIDYVNEMDFAAISYYPFFMGLHNKAEFQIPLDLINTRINVPIAFSETAHLAENLIVTGLDINISSDECEQNEYLETLFQNAQNERYEFVIWWTHRDYDILWQSFPDEVKDIGQIWRDTGILDEDGNERKSAITWDKILR